MKEGWKVLRRDSIDSGRSLVSAQREEGAHTKHAYSPIMQTTAKSLIISNMMHQLSNPNSDSTFICKVIRSRMKVEVDIILEQYTIGIAQIGIPWIP